MIMFWLIITGYEMCCLPVNSNGHDTQTRLSIVCLPVLRATLDKQIIQAPENT